MGYRAIIILACMGVVPLACSSGGESGAGQTGGVSGLGGDASSGSDAGAGGSAGVGADGHDESPPDAAQVDAGQLKELCAPQCEKVSAAGCPAAPGLGACISTCKVEADLYASTCGVVTDEYWKCKASAATHVCSTDYGGYALERGCIGENIAFWACAICLPTPSYDACDTCRAEKCCDEWSKYFKSPEYKTFMECNQKCDSIACGGACLNADGPAGDALDACAVAKCSNECS